MGLITFEGKPIEKLIDVISQGIGTLYKPRAIRNEADAEAYKIGIIERAKATAIADNKIIDIELQENIHQRVIYQEAKKQNNIDNVIEIAAEQLNLEQHVSDEKLDQDWTTRFFNTAENISDEEMQNLWGRILAGEIKQPKSFSLRTLELLKNLSKQEAEVFNKFAQLKITNYDTHFVLNTDRAYLERNFGITFSDILLLTELGLISGDPNLQVQNSAAIETTAEIFEYGTMGIGLTRDVGALASSVRVMRFTKTGFELSTLVYQNISLDYIKKVCNAFSQPKVKIQYGILEKLPDRFLLNNVTVFKPE
jgi:uncharacterized repeat protein (TIGR03899 family)